MMRLQKFLSAAGVASRRRAEELITAGEISVNERIVTKLGSTVDEVNDIVSYRGKLLAINPQKIYIALNKPMGYVSSTSDIQGPSVLALVKSHERLYPVGRLDKDSSGLLVLTNDGELANQLMHPRYKLEKEYFVALDQTIRPEDVKKLERGFIVGKERLSSLKVMSSQNASARLVLNGGANRQIRRMIGKLGYTVNKLKRVRIGKLEIGDLEEKKWRLVKKEDII
jgi:pseudouridine synthase